MKTLSIDADRELLANLMPGDVLVTDYTTMLIVSRYVNARGRTRYTTFHTYWIDGEALYGSDVVIDFNTWPPMTLIRSEIARTPSRAETK